MTAKNTEKIKTECKVKFENNEEVQIELHSKIIPSCNKDFYSITGDGWNWIKCHSSFEYVLLHFAKHYRDVGTGIIQLVDLELMGEEKDFSYIGLNAFYENVLSVLQCWFNGKQYSSTDLLISSETFRNGAYGVDDNRAQF